MNMNKRTPIFQAMAFVRGEVNVISSLDSKIDADALLVGRDGRGRMMDQIARALDAAPTRRFGVGCSGLRAHLHRGPRAPWHRWPS